ncbi:MAG: hypothetical protein RLW62_20710, partial [Gammaproteobacteria bacterium]
LVICHWDLPSPGRKARHFNLLPPLIARAAHARVTTPLREWLPGRHRAHLHARVTPCEPHRTTTAPAVTRHAATQGPR